jgi:tetratricopeptide (TPR) repeat protein
VGRVADRLRPLWDFDDLDGSEQRFQQQFEQGNSDAGRAEVLTQLARVQGLRSEFDECARLLDEAEALAGSSPVAKIRIELERGRMFRSSGDLEAALPLFQSAFTRACNENEYYLAGDAAHMCAIAVTDRDAMEDWTQRGLELGRRESEAAYWAGPLLNNLGWAYYDTGDYERALELFQRALAARERDRENENAIAWARYGVGQTLRMLERAEEAIAMLEQAVAWAERSGTPEPSFHEELAEDYAAFGRADEAREHAARAAELRAY